jgi:hypothetical protein
VYEAGRGAPSTAPPATAKQTVNEFGVEGGEAEEPPSAGAGAGATETREPDLSSAPTPQAAWPSTNSAGTGSSGSQSSSEFGM